MIDKEIAVNRDHTFYFDYFEDGIQVVPSAATITIYDNGGTVIVNAASCTVETDGTVYYTLVAATNDETGKNFRIKQTYTVSGVSKVVNYLFDVVETPLINVVSDDDLFSYLHDLRDRVKERTFQTSSTGTTTTTVCSGMKADTRDYTGGYLTIYYKDTSNCGDTVQHDARITAYDKATGTCTFTPAFTVAIPSGTSVNIRPSFQSLIDRVFIDHTLRDVRNAVGLAAGYIDSTTVSNMTTFKALEIYCFGQSEQNDDKWDRRAAKFKAMYDEEFGKLRAAYDRDGDGHMTETEDEYRPNGTVIRIIR